MSGNLIANPDLWKLRAVQMMKLKVRGYTYKQIAEKFNLSVDTVRDSVNTVAQGELLKELERGLIEDLVPEAFVIYKEQLGKKDVKVAMDVMDKLVKISTRTSKEKQHQQQLGLKAYLEEKRDSRRVSKDRSNTIEVRPIEIPGEEPEDIFAAAHAEGWLTGDGPEPPKPTFEFKVNPEIAKGIGVSHQSDGVAGTGQTSPNPET